jgi:uncharacterized protein YndB with AHSA1/START domain
MEISMPEALAADPGHSLSLTRDFAASPQRLWRAWTDPAVLVRWLGPHDWPAVEASNNLRVGGAWRACLRSPVSGEELWQSGRYLRLDPPERLEFTFLWEGDNHEDGPGVETRIAVRLEALSDKHTRMHMVQSGLVSPQSAAGHTGGWSQTFDRLQTLIDEGGNP